MTNTPLKHTSNAVLQLATRSLAVALSASIILSTPGSLAWANPDKVPGQRSVGSTLRQTVSLEVIDKQTGLSMQMVPEFDDKDVFHYRPIVTSKNPERGLTKIEYLQALGRLAEQVAIAEQAYNGAKEGKNPIAAAAYASIAGASNHPALAVLGNNERVDVRNVSLGGPNSLAAGVIKEINKEIGYAYSAKEVEVLNQIHLKANQKEMAGQIEKMPEASTLIGNMKDTQKKGLENQSVLLSILTQAYVEQRLRGYQALTTLNKLNESIQNINADIKRLERDLSVAANPGVSFAAAKVGEVATTAPNPQADSLRQQIAQLKEYRETLKKQTKQPEDLEAVINDANDKAKLAESQISQLSGKEFKLEGAGKTFKSLGEILSYIEGKEKELDAIAAKYQAYKAGQGAVDQSFIDKLKMAYARSVSVPGVGGGREISALIGAIFASDEINQARDAQLQMDQLTTMQDVLKGEIAKIQEAFQNSTQSKNLKNALAKQDSELWKDIQNGTLLKGVRKFDEHVIRTNNEIDRLTRLAQTLNDLRSDPNATPAQIQAAINQYLSGEMGKNISDAFKAGVIDKNQVAKVINSKQASDAYQQVVAYYKGAVASSNVERHIANQKEVGAAQAEFLKTEYALYNKAVSGDNASRLAMEEMGYRLFDKNGRTFGADENGFKKWSEANAAHETVFQSDFYSHQLNRLSYGDKMALGLRQQAEENPGVLAATAGGMVVGVALTPVTFGGSLTLTAGLAAGAGTAIVIGGAAYEGYTARVGEGWHDARVAMVGGASAAIGTLGTGFAGMLAKRTVSAVWGARSLSAGMDTLVGVEKAAENATLGSRFLSWGFNKVTTEGFRTGLSNLTSMVPSLPQPVVTGVKMIWQADKIATSASMGVFGLSNAIGMNTGAVDTSYSSGYGIVRFNEGLMGSMSAPSNAMFFGTGAMLYSGAKSALGGDGSFAKELAIGTLNNSPVNSVLGLAKKFTGYEGPEFMFMKDGGKLVRDSDGNRIMNKSTAELVANMSGPQWALAKTALTATDLVGFGASGQLFGALGKGIGTAIGRTRAVSLIGRGLSSNSIVGTGSYIGSKLGLAGEKAFIQGLRGGITKTAAVASGLPTQLPVLGFYQEISHKQGAEFWQELGVMAGATALSKGFSGVATGSMSGSASHTKPNLVTSFIKDTAHEFVSLGAVTGMMKLAGPGMLANGIGYAKAFNVHNSMWNAAETRQATKNQNIASFRENIVTQPDGSIGVKGWSTDMVHAFSYGGKQGAEALALVRDNVAPQGVLARTATSLKDGATNLVDRVTTQTKEVGLGLRDAAANNEFAVPPGVNLRLAEAGLTRNHQEAVNRGLIQEAANQVRRPGTTPQGERIVDSVTYTGEGTTGTKSLTVRAGAGIVLAVAGSEAPVTEAAAPPVSSPAGVVRSARDHATESAAHKARLESNLSKASNPAEKAQAHQQLADFNRSMAAYEVARNGKNLSDAGIREMQAAANYHAAKAAETEARSQALGTATKLREQNSQLRAAEKNGDTEAIARLKQEMKDVDAGHAALKFSAETARQQANDAARLYADVQARNSQSVLGLDSTVRTSPRSANADKRTVERAFNRMNQKVHEKEVSDSQNGVDSQSGKVSITQRRSELLKQIQDQYNNVDPAQHRAHVAPNERAAIAAKRTVLSDVAREIAEGKKSNATSKEIQQEIRQRVQTETARLIAEAGKGGTKGSYTPIRETDATIAKARRMVATELREGRNRLAESNAELALAKAKAAEQTGNTSDVSVEQAAGKLAAIRQAKTIKTLEAQLENVRKESEGLRDAQSKQKLNERKAQLEDQIAFEQSRLELAKSKISGNESEIAEAQRRVEVAQEAIMRNMETRARASDLEAYQAATSRVEALQAEIKANRNPLQREAFTTIFSERKSDAELKGELTLAKAEQQIARLRANGVAERSAEMYEAKTVLARIKARQENGPSQSEGIIASVKEYFSTKHAARESVHHEYMLSEVFRGLPADMQAKAQWMMDVVNAETAVNPLAKKTYNHQTGKFRFEGSKDAPTEVKEQIAKFNDALDRFEDASKLSLRTNQFDQILDAVAGPRVFLVEGTGGGKTKVLSPAIGFLLKEMYGDAVGKIVFEYPDTNLMKQAFADIKGVFAELKTAEGKEFSALDLHPEGIEAHPEATLKQVQEADFVFASRDTLKQLAMAATAAKDGSAVEVAIFNTLKDRGVLVRDEAHQLGGVDLIRGDQSMPLIEADRKMHDAFIHVDGVLESMRGKMDYAQFYRGLDARDGKGSQENSGYLFGQRVRKTLADGRVQWESTFTDAFLQKYVDARNQAHPENKITLADLKDASSSALKYEAAALNAFAEAVGVGHLSESGYGLPTARVTKDGKTLQAGQVVPMSLGRPNETMRFGDTATAGARQLVGGRLLAEAGEWKASKAELTAKELLAKAEANGEAVRVTDNTVGRHFMGDIRITGSALGVREQQIIASGLRMGRDSAPAINKYGENGMLPYRDAEIHNARNVQEMINDVASRVENRRISVVGMETNEVDAFAYGPALVQRLASGKTETGGEKFVVVQKGDQVEVFGANGQKVGETKSSQDLGEILVDAKVQKNYLGREFGQKDQITIILDQGGVTGTDIKIPLGINAVEKNITTLAKLNGATKGSEIKLSREELARVSIDPAIRTHIEVVGENKSNSVVVKIKSPEALRARLSELKTVETLGRLMQGSPVRSAEMKATIEFLSQSTDASANAMAKLLKNKRMDGVDGIGVHTGLKDRMTPHFRDYAEGVFSEYRKEGVYFHSVFSEQTYAKRSIQTSGRDRGIGVAKFGYHEKSVTFMSEKSVSAKDLVRMVSENETKTNQQNAYQGRIKSLQESMMLRFEHMKAQAQSAGELASIEAARRDFERTQGLNSTLGEGSKPLASTSLKNQVAQMQRTFNEAVGKRKGELSQLNREFVNAKKKVTVELEFNGKEGQAWAEKDKGLLGMSFEAQVAAMGRNTTRTELNFEVGHSQPSAVTVAETYINSAKARITETSGRSTDISSELKQAHRKAVQAVRTGAYAQNATASPLIGLLAASNGDINDIRNILLGTTSNPGIADLGVSFVKPTAITRISEVASNFGSDFKRAWNTDGVPVYLKSIHAIQQVVHEFRQTLNLDIPAQAKTLVTTYQNHPEQVGVTPLITFAQQNPQAMKTALATVQTQELLQTLAPIQVIANTGSNSAVESGVGFKVVNGSKGITITVTQPSERAMVRVAELAQYAEAANVSVIISASGETKTKLETAFAAAPNVTIQTTSPAAQLAPWIKSPIASASAWFNNQFGGIQEFGFNPTTFINLQQQLINSTGVEANPLSQMMLPQLRAQMAEQRQAARTLRTLSNQGLINLDASLAQLVNSVGDLTLEELSPAITAYQNETGLVPAVEGSQPNVLPVGLQGRKAFANKTQLQALAGAVAMLGSSAIVSVGIVTGAIATALPIITGVAVAVIFMGPQFKAMFSGEKVQASTESRTFVLPQYVSLGLGVASALFFMPTLGFMAALPVLAKAMALVTLFDAGLGLLNYRGGDVVASSQRTLEKVTTFLAPHKMLVARMAGALSMIAVVPAFSSTYAAVYGATEAVATPTGAIISTGGFGVALSLLAVALGGLGYYFFTSERTRELRNSMRENFRLHA